MNRILAFICAVVMMFSLSLPAFAAEAPILGPGIGYGCGMGGYVGFMCDDNGIFLDREAFEEKLDKYIEDGIIAAEDKDAYLEQYDYCAEYGCGSIGVGGRGRGCGRGMGRGRWA